MRKPFFLLFLLCFATGYSTLNAQTIIINKYAAVLANISCNTLTVDTAADFNIGDTVLMIQMKGAIIDSSNTSGFGNIVDYRGAGNYEYNVIKAKNGNNLTLLYTIVRAYNIPEGKVQLVRVPYFQNYTVSQAHTCMPWNGNKGGVFAIHVANTLTMNQDIDVSGKGFRGGTGNPSTQVGPPSICSNPRYYMGPDFDSTASKGEGIAEVSLSRSFGRGKLGNGGGGGNTCNAGGGGGGNGNSGGLGGSEYRGCNNNPSSSTAGGIGGGLQVYTTANNKIFMGGGGGAGQANNLNNTAGGNGGGICIITAGSVSGNTRDIKANGADGFLCTNMGTFGSCHDGMGGGGGGGIVLMNTNTITNIVHVFVMGGKGANESGNSGYLEVGPGGGGGGGVLWSKPSTVLPNLILNNAGGLNGTVLYNSSAWGAEPGLTGLSLNNLVLNFPTDTFHTHVITADFSDAIINCFKRRFTDESTILPSGGISWLWLFPNNQTATQQNPEHIFPGYGIFPVTLIVTNTSGCLTTDTITKNITIPYVPFADAGNDTTICAGSSLTLNASGGTTYSWLPVTGLTNPNAATTTAKINSPISYIVTITNAQGCTDKDTVLISTTPGQAADITSDGTVINCDNRSTVLTASGATSYAWSPAAYCDNSESATPKVSPPATTLFTVTATSADGCISQDTITVFVYSEKAAIFMPNAFSPNNDGLNDNIGPEILCGFTIEQFAVFNHWGEKVFIAEGPDTKWNGNHKGKPSELSTYYYYIRGKSDDGTVVSFKGDFLLIR
jgi:gliding motility-associated-like protein